MRIFFPAGHELARRFIQGKQDNHKGTLSEKKTIQLDFLQKLAVKARLT